MEQQQNTMVVRCLVERAPFEYGTLYRGNEALVPFEEGERLISIGYAERVRDVETLAAPQVAAEAGQPFGEAIARRNTRADRALRGAVTR